MSPIKTFENYESSLMDDYIHNTPSDFWKKLLPHDLVMLGWKSGGYTKQADRQYGGVTIKWDTPNGGDWYNHPSAPLSLRYYKGSWVCWYMPTHGELIAEWRGGRWVLTEYDGEGKTSNHSVLVAQFNTYESFNKICDTYSVPDMVIRTRKGDAPFYEYTSEYKK